MVRVRRLEESEISEQDALHLTKNLLRVAISTISYIRGLFPEKYFNVQLVPAVEIKTNMLMPNDAESRRLIDWIEKGVSDALQKKYLKTLHFCICEKNEDFILEEYSFSFRYPNRNGEKVAMGISCSGLKMNKTTFQSDDAEITPDQMRNSACKMISTLVSLMRTLDPMPEERTIMMKLLYNDESTPEDYEPPLFKCCTDSETLHKWKKNPLLMQLGNFNSKHFVLALKVKSVLDPCGDECSDIEVSPPQADRYILAPNDGSQDPANGDDLMAKEMVEDIMERLLKDGVLSMGKKDGCTVNQVADPKTRHVKKEVMPNLSPTEDKNIGDLMCMKGLYPALPTGHVTIAKLQGNMNGETNQNTTRKLIEKMLPEGYMKNSANQTFGNADSQYSNIKLLENDSIVEGHEDEKKNNIEHDQFGCKDLLKSQRIRNGSTIDGLSSAKSDETQSSPGKRSRKCSLSINCALGCLLCINPKPALHRWRIDSGASYHMSGGGARFRNERPIEVAIPELHGAADEEVVVDKMGDIMHPRLRLYDVYLSSTLEKEELYVSIGQLTKDGYDVLIKNDGTVTIHLSQNFNHIVGRGSLNPDAEAYLLEFFNGSIVGEKTEDEYNGTEVVWLLDSGSPHHLTGDISLLSEQWDLEQPVTVETAGGAEIKIVTEGNVSMPKFVLNNVYYDLQLGHNLVSVPKLNRMGYQFYYTGEKCYIYIEENFLEGLAYRHWENNVYYIDFLYPKG